MTIKLLCLVYQDQQYKQCANLAGNMWCSTETDENNNHIESSWVEGCTTTGWYNKHCPACRTQLGNNCVFPRVETWNGFTYSACSTHDGDDPWCYTVGTGWGYCQNSCIVKPHVEVKGTVSFFSWLPHG